MTKRGKTILLITFLSLIVLGLISFMVSVIVNGKNNFIGFKFIEKTSTNLIYDKEYSDDFNEIKINSDAAKIEVINSDTANVKVKMYSEKQYKNKIINNSGVLNVISYHKSKFVGFNQKIAKIEIYIPEDFNKTINITNNYGDIYVEDFIDANINVESDAGDIDVDMANTLEIKNSYGDTKIGKVNDINLESNCGDVKIDEVRSAEVSNDLGDIEIKNVKEYLDVTADCGDIDIDKISLTKNSKIVNNLGDIEIKDIKNVYIDAKTDMGKVSVNNNNQKSDITLKIENDCGDIDVNN